MPTSCIDLAKPLFSAAVCKPIFSLTTAMTLPTQRAKTYPTTNTTTIATIFGASKITWVHACVKLSTNACFETLTVSAAVCPTRDKSFIPHSSF